MAAVAPGFAPARSLQLPRLRPDQSRIVRHPAKVKILAIGRRWGKTILGIVTALSCAASGGRVAWVVPTYKNARAVWRAAENAASTVRSPFIRINKTEHSIEFLDTGGHLVVYSADNPDAIRGEAFNLIIGDEAARFDESLWTDVLQPTLADVDGDAILISTPKGRNWFYRAWELGNTDGVHYASFTAPSSANPNPMIQAAARRARLLVPESTYLQEWEAQFVEDSSIIFSRDWWGAFPDGTYRNRYSTSDWRQSNQVIARFLSFDTAMKDKTSADFSACTVAELLPDWRLRVRHVWRDRVSFPNLVSAVERLTVDFNRDNKLRAILIEDKVSGISLYQTLVSAMGDKMAAHKVVAWPPPPGTKGQRAGLAAVWCRRNCVLLPEPSEDVPWLYPFEQELYAMTPIESEYEHDDMADTLVQVILYLEATEQVMSRGADARDHAAVYLAAQGKGPA